jgi:cysteine desulfurase/selenocysteine lyase
MDLQFARKEFPILNQKVNGRNLVYLDNAATSQKPQAVINATSEYYSEYNSNVHRGLHTLAAKADKAWTAAHETVTDFINASPEEVFFIRNASEGLNWVVNTIGRQRLKKGNVVVISEMEHHSNIVPWRMLRNEIDFTLEVLPITETHELDFAHLEKLVEKYGDKIKVVSLIHKSNVLGVTIDAKKVREVISSTKALFVLDGAQSIVHEKIDVQELSCDVFIFSGHKIYGPTGSGAVYGRRELLESLEPWMGGGDMIKEVKADSIEWNDLPMKFEAGTPNIAGGIGLAVALNWFTRTIEKLGGWEKYRAYQKELTMRLHEGLSKVRGVKLLSGPNSESLVSFEVGHMHTHDISTLLDERGIAIRAGFHCAQPLHEKLGSKGSVRASFGIYNTQEDIDAMIEAMTEIVEMF